jgi:hypothetical protein
VLGGELGGGGAPVDPTDQRHPLRVEEVDEVLTGVGHERARLATHAFDS